MDDLATADQLADYLQTTVDAPTAALALARASADIRTWLRQDVTVVTDDEVTLIGGGSVIALPQFPVTACAVELDGEAFTAWRVVDDNLLQRTDGLAWPTLVDVVYTHGWAAVPDDIVGACLALAARQVTNPTDMRSESIDDYAYTVAEDADDQLAAALRKLAPYRSHSSSPRVTLVGDA